MVETGFYGLAVFPEFVTRQINFVVPDDAMTTSINGDFVKEIVLFKLIENWPFLEERLYIVALSNTVAKVDYELVIFIGGNAVDFVKHEDSFIDCAHFVGNTYE